MSTADVRAGSTCDEEEAAEAGHAPEDGAGAEAGAREEGRDAAPDARDTPDARDDDGAAAPSDTGDGEESAWDDGLIARRARGTGPGERPGRSRAAALWGTDPSLPEEASPEVRIAPQGAAEPRAEAASGAQPSLRSRLPDQPVTGWPVSDGHQAHSYDSESFDEGNALGRRVVALRRLVDLSRTRLPRRLLAEADRVLDAADARERLSRRYTTVAIAGATGSGKSSLFNALAGTRLSQAGMRRPTTATPVACSWEAPGAGSSDALLDRLGIPPSMRRLMRPESDWRGRIDEAARSELEGLVLIDMPDHDSAAEGHREQVERLLRLVDAVVWVVDPEKYADAVLHERYLRPLAGYAEVTFIVLNQTDRLPGDATGTVLHDLRRLLDEDGMALSEHGEPGARVLATSALVGEGIDELRAELAGFVSARRAAALRLSADLDMVVERLRPVYTSPETPTGGGAPVGLTEDVREEFFVQLARAAGAVSAGRAAERSWLRRAERACGTPWSRLRRRHEERRTRKETPPDAHPVGPDDGYDFEPDGADGAEGFGEAAAPAGPSAGAHPRVARPAVAHAVRTVVDQAAAGLPEAWRRSVRDAAWRGASGLPEALDEALREGAEAGGRADGSDGAAAGPAAPPRRPFWWNLALAGQAVLFVLLLAGAGAVAGAALGVRVVPEWAGAALFAVGALGGSVLAWGCRRAARGPAAEHGRLEELRLRRLVAGCGQVHVLEPVAAELLRYREVREQYVIAAGDASPL